MNVRTLCSFAVLLCGVACVDVTTRANLDHCTFNEGDRYCAELFVDRPFCTQGQNECSSGERYGCVAEVTPECHRPCGSLGEEECMATESSSSTDTETSTGSESSTSSSTGSESESSSTTGPAPCMGNDDCTDPAAPFCDLAVGECVACDRLDDPNGGCAALDPTEPLCVEGVCVQCTPEVPAACIGLTPVCDEATNTCVPCTAHDQCGDAACNLFTGACLPADAVLHVGPGQTFVTIAAAVASTPVGAEGTIVVHQASYNEAVTVSGGRVLAFLAADGELPEWLRTMDPNAPQLTVGAGSTALVDGLRLSGNDSAADPALFINGGQAWVDRSRLVQNAGGGIVTENNGELVLRNCFVGDGTNAANAITINGASAEIVYSSMGTGFSAFDDVYSLACTAPLSVTVRNSFLVSFDNVPSELACAAATVSASASEALIPGAGNIALGDVAADWFVDIMTGDFHLDNRPAAVATTAQWAAGDPLTDIDGDLRPAVNGSPDYAGADLP